MWPEPTINVTQRHLFCELKDLHLCLWPPVLTEPCLQFEILCCSSLTLRQPVSSYGICSSHKLMQECTWVCVWLKIPTEIFFFLCMADSVYKVHIARGCEGVCESRCACFSPLYVIKTVSFVSQQAPVSKNFYPASCVCFILACMETNHSVSDLDIWLLRKWTHNTVMWAVKGNVPWMIFVFFFLQRHIN